MNMNKTLKLIPLTFFLFGCGSSGGDTSTASSSAATSSSESSSGIVSSSNDIHNHVAGEPVVLRTENPTCTEDGYQIVATYCKECGEQLTSDTLVLPALGHDLHHYDGQAPTCTDFGWEEYDACSRCDYTTYQIIPATGHVETKQVKENEVKADCLNDGSYDLVTYCLACEEELTRETINIPALGHDFVLESEIIPATYEAEGQALYKCSRCDAEETRVIPQLEHHFSEEWSFDESKQTHYHRCLDEGFETLRNSEAGHTYDDETPVQTDIDPHIYAKTCNVCGYQYTSVVKQDDDTKYYPSLNSYDIYYLTGYCGGTNVYLQGMYKNYYGTYVEEGKVSGDATTLIFGGSFEYIADGAFVGYSSLKTIIMDKNVYAMDCKLATERYIVASGNNGKFTSFNDCLYKNDTLTRVPKKYQSDSLYIRYDTTTIGYQAVAFCKLKFVDAGSSLITIGQSAFEYDAQLEAINLPHTLTSIGKYAFNLGNPNMIINYAGTMEEWNAVKKGDQWDYDSNGEPMNFKVICTDGEIN